MSAHSIASETVPASKFESTVKNLKALKPGSERVPSVPIKLNPVNIAVAEKTTNAAFIA